MANPSFTELSADWPEKPTRDRENLIVAAVRAGNYLPLRWVPLVATYNGMKATFQVMADTLKLGNDEDAVRVNVTAEGQQRIAHLLGAYLPTARLVEMAYEQGVRITPCLQPPDARMGYTSRMVEHSHAVDAKVAGQTGLVAGNAGKHWTLSNHIIDQHLDGGPMAENFGWFRRQIRPFKPYQTPGHRHNTFHTDYSQICWLIGNQVDVDGTLLDLEEVLTSPSLAGLAHHEPLRRVTIPISSSVELDAAETSAPTLEAPPDAPAADAVAGWRTLRLGMNGSDVQAWQQCLLDAGHDLGASGADGDFGARTHSATVAWQVAHGLPADGVVGLKTKALVATSRT